MNTENNQSSNRSDPNTVQDSFRGAGEQLSMAANSAKDTALQYGSHYLTEPAKDLFGLLQDYAKSRPEVAAVWCFGLGLFIGWKLRP
jgi:hypothetical protein